MLWLYVIGLVLSSAFTVISQESGPFIGQSNRNGLIFPGQLVITFRRGVDLRSLMSSMERATVEQGMMDGPRQIGVRTFVLSLKEPFTVQPSSEPPDLIRTTMDAKRAFESRDYVESVEPVYIVYPFRIPNDPRYSAMWHYHTRGTGVLEAPGGANFPGAWASTIGDAAIKVAVIDTGILLNEPEFRNSPNLLPGVDLIADPWMANDDDSGTNGDSLDYDDDPTDPGDSVEAFECGTLQWRAREDSWHGSHVGGTVGAGRTDDGNGISGATWQVSIIPIRALGRCGGRTDDIANAIRWAAGVSVAGVKDNPHGPVDIINLSLGLNMPCSEVQLTLQSAINDALAAGVLTVAAAGNDSIDVSGVSPAGCDNVITVAAGDWRGFLANQYSNFGDDVDIMAPGGDVRRDDNNDGNGDGILSVVKGGFEYYNGTSMAAPHVAGAVALLLAKDSALRAMSGPAKLAEVTRRLHKSAAPRSDIECPKSCGAGLLDVEKLIEE